MGGTLVKVPPFLEVTIKETEVFSVPEGSFARSAHNKLNNLSLEPGAPNTPHPFPAPGCASR